jgi:hypothetical protein
MLLVVQITDRIRWDEIAVLGLLEDRGDDTTPPTEGVDSDGDQTR